jgi:hypothetical protein
MGSLHLLRPAPMRTNGPRLRLRNCFAALRAAGAALACLAAAAAPAQHTSLAFWEPPPSADALLDHAPRRDPDRYAALRQAFIEYHCTPDLMQEQPAGTHGDRNLICTLPGQTPGSILVAARYDGRAGAGFQSTWVDAYFLPLLDHAIQAQPRHHTFVFAALFGEEGERAYFSALHNSGKPLPSAMFVLDGLGWGAPLWYTVPAVKATPSHPADLGVNGLLGGVAAGIGRFMKVPDPTPLTPGRFLTESGFSAAEYYRSQRYESTLFRSAGAIPELLLYSDRPESATMESVDLETASIRKDLDYTAYVLCLADVKLEPEPAPAPASPPPDSAPH